MGIFGKRKTVNRIDYDPETEYPVIRASICNGEKVAGIRSKTSATFREIMTIRTNEDLLVFKQMCGVEEVKTEY
ncbi:MAG: aspartate dehydrogenase [Lachnospiraceae bacterium]|nr:aspartate dehydrogenase [Lachnospiraceae bacterium]